jgi:predicted aspartyl protease
MSRRSVYPLEMRNGLLFLRVAVGDGVRQPVIARLLVDTGSSFTVLSTQVLEDAGCSLQSPQSAISITAAGGVVRGKLFEVRHFSALGQTLENFRVVGFNLPKSADMDGLLGIDFMRSCGAIVDTGKACILIPSIGNL